MIGHHQYEIKGLVRRMLGNSQAIRPTFFCLEGKSQLLSPKQNVADGWDTFQICNIAVPRRVFWLDPNIENKAGQKAPKRLP
ncbi:hypothetical protein CUMW_276110 [Citrus unshiu]|uniref:Uncharacterized protein n=1 Tax=Citrus unshiu TaxID=55188 RepID=A0A2H5N1Y7_CITUN|nr:hypothetical protein CUMW_276110 [Citrus unshiu]